MPQPPLAQCPNSQGAQGPQGAQGAYVVAIAIASPLDIRLGKAAPILLRPGRYLYFGSAYGPGGLRARLGRHFRKQKTIRWHVDQLTTAGEVLGAWAVPQGDECALVRRLDHLPVPIEGFGASDCATCRSHLLRWPRRVPRRAIVAALSDDTGAPPVWLRARA